MFSVIKDADLRPYEYQLSTYFAGKSGTSPVLTIARYNKAQTSALVATFLEFNNFLWG
jgi:hypothetical protein